MAPLFSKADLNKFWHYVQNEVTLICAKFGKDLFSISKVIGRKTKGHGFLAYPVHMGRRYENKDFFHRCMHSFVAVTSGRSVEHRQYVYSSRPAGWLQQRKACALLLITQDLQQRDVAGAINQAITPPTACNL